MQINKRTTQCWTLQRLIHTEKVSKVGELRGVQWIQRSLHREGGLLPVLLVWVIVPERNLFSQLVLESVFDERCCWWEVCFGRWEKGKHICRSEELMVKARDQERADFNMFGLQEYFFPPFPYSGNSTMGLLWAKSCFYSVFWDLQWQKNTSFTDSWTQWRQESGLNGESSIDTYTWCIRTYICTVVCEIDSCWEVAYNPGSPAWCCVMT